jgi:hypothetical protein
MNRNEFLTYLMQFYGRNGRFPLVREGKYLTRMDLRAYVAEASARPDWDWNGGDTLDRWFMRDYVLEPAGWCEEA